MRTIAIIQARMGSTRLPGKVLLKLHDKTILEHIVNRVSKANGINEIVVATSILNHDDVIIEEAARLNVLSFRGSESDVLSRYYQAAKFYEAEYIIRITADCPLLDASLLSNMLADFDSRKKNGELIDYSSNAVIRTYPRGLDLEIFTFSALEKAYYGASLEYQREHVTPYIHQNPDLFNLHHYLHDKNLSYHRWTLDTPDDLMFMTVIYNELYNKDHCFTSEQLLQLLEQKPWITDINKNVVQKEMTNDKGINNAN